LSYKQINVKGIQFCECGLPITGKGWKRENKDIICNLCYDKEKPVIEKPVEKIFNQLSSDELKVEELVNEESNRVLYEHQVELRLTRITIQLHKINLNKKPSYISDYDWKYVTNAKRTKMYDPTASNSFNVQYVNKAALTVKQYKSLEYLERIFLLSVIE